MEWKTDKEMVGNSEDKESDLTENEPVKHKPYPIPYKVQEIIDKEIDNMLAMRVIEHSEARWCVLDEVNVC